MRSTRARRVARPRLPRLTVDKSAGRDDQEAGMRFRWPLRALFGVARGVDVFMTWAKYARPF